LVVVPGLFERVPEVPGFAHAGEGTEVAAYTAIDLQDLKSASCSRRD